MGGLLALEEWFYNATLRLVKRWSGAGCYRRVEWLKLRRSIKFPFKTAGGSMVLR